jgi:hypothetical protein
MNVVTVLKYKAFFATMSIGISSGAVQIVASVWGIQSITNAALKNVMEKRELKVQLWVNRSAV